MVDSYKRPISVYINWILEHIQKIQKYVSDISSFDEFLDDEKTSDACITQLLQLGETVVQLKHHYPDENFLYEKDMISMRNFLVHCYHKVELRVVRNTIQKNIPEVLIMLNNKYPDIINQ